MVVNTTQKYEIFGIYFYFFNIICQFSPISYMYNLEALIHLSNSDSSSFASDQVEIPLELVNKFSIPSTKDNSPDFLVSLINGTW